MVENPPPHYPSITIDQTLTYQEMTGFGGALTWYCDRIVTSPQQEEITDLLFVDLGMDILRLKNWYYPADYPANTSTDVMSPAWFGNHFHATNQLYTIARTKSPDIKVLFSSWGPPPALKSNDHLNEGTLQKNPDGSFMYEQLGQYFVDILDHLAFTPDYLSIQNEPSYTNPGWETCEWRATQTLSYPGYDQGLDVVYHAVKDRADVPVFIGPESPNISNTSGGTSFFHFAEAIRDRSFLGMYAWHPYNFGTGTNPNSTISPLKSIWQQFDDRPNMMTEFSDNLSWLATARFINNTLIYANTSAYIYWKGIWGENNDEHAMVYVSGAGDYEVRPFYYLMKHFAKHIDRGYVRVAAASTDSGLETSAFLSPDKQQMTVIVINTTASNITFVLNLPGFAGTQLQVFQSMAGAQKLYHVLNNLSLDEPILLPGNTVSTFVITL